jgi:carbonic anhydrase
VTGGFHPSTPELVIGNAAFARRFEGARMPAAPARRLAVVACMDARIDVPRILGLQAGEAHIIRNAGGVVTDDVIRSLCLSQRLLGTREVVLVHHTGCGLQLLDEQRFLAELEAETGIRPTWPLEAFADPYADVIESMRRLHSSPFLPCRDHIRAFVYDVADGKLHEARPPTV